MAPGCGGGFEGWLGVKGCDVMGCVNSLAQNRFRVVGRRFCRALKRFRFLNWENRRASSRCRLEGRLFCRVANRFRFLNWENFRASNRSIFRKGENVRASTRSRLAYGLFCPSVGRVRSSGGHFSSFVGLGGPGGAVFWCVRRAGAGRGV